MLWLFSVTQETLVDCTVHLQIHSCMVASSYPKNHWTLHHTLRILGPSIAKVTPSIVVPLVRARILRVLQISVLFQEPIPTPTGGLFFYVLLFSQKVIRRVVVCFVRSSISRCPPSQPPATRQQHPDLRRHPGGCSIPVLPQESWTPKVKVLRAPTSAMQSQNPP